MQKHATAYRHRLDTIKSIVLDVCFHYLLTVKKSQSKWLKGTVSDILAFRGNERLEGQRSINEHRRNRICWFKFSGSWFLRSLSCKEQGTCSSPPMSSGKQGILGNLVERLISSKEKQM
jgi:hypothetical protein